jgi:hypothetical protein
MVEVDNNSET